MCRHRYCSILQGNPFCLHPHYLSAVQHALPLLQHFDGTRVQLAAPVCKDTVASSTNSFVAVGHSLSSVAAQQRLHICFSQLSVQNTVPCRLSIPGAAVEPAPPAYYYYLQLRSRGDGLLCGFPSVLTPQGELARWQAQQSADQSMAGGKKPAGKKAPAGKAGKADASATEQRNAWYQEVAREACLRSNQLPQGICRPVLLCPCAYELSDSDCPYVLQVCDWLSLCRAV